MIAWQALYPLSFYSSSTCLDFFFLENQLPNLTKCLHQEECSYLWKHLRRRHLKARSGSMVIGLAWHNNDCKANKFRAQPSGRQNIWEPYAGLCSCFSSCDARRKASFYWGGKINSEAMSVPKRSKQKRYTCSSAWWLPGQPACLVNGCPWWRIMTPVKTQWPYTWP